MRALEVRAQVLDHAVHGVAVEQQEGVVVADAVQAAQDVLLRGASHAIALCLTGAGCVEQSLHVLSSPTPPCHEHPQHWQVGFSRSPHAHAQQT